MTSRQLPHTTKSMRSVAGGFVVGCSLALVGCGLLDPEPFVDFSTFDPLPPLVDLDGTTVRAGSGVTYWELREAQFGGSYRVLLSGGTASRSELAPDVRVVLDSARVFNGFAPSCLPGGCFHYFATVDTSGAVATWNSAEMIPSLFAPVESLAEAAMLARAHGFDWSFPIEKGAVRQDADVWQLVVTRLIRGCDPIQVDRFLIEVSPAGDVLERKREVYSRQYGVCI